MSWAFYEETILCVFAAIGIVAVFREIIISRIMRNCQEKLMLIIAADDDSSCAAAFAIKKAAKYCFPRLLVETIKIEAVAEENGERACQN